MVWGNQSENEADKVIHGTSNDGARNGMAKLTEEQVVRIRQLYSSGRYNQREIAEMFLISQSRISVIVNGKSWKA